jgi:stearoyl-CoA desaturase (delta-9 desaturase)
MKLSGPENGGQLECLSSVPFALPGRGQTETLAANSTGGAYALSGSMGLEARQITDDYPLPRRKVNWAGLIFFIVVHVVGIVGTPLYIYYRGITAPEVALFFFFAVATGMSITMGYHRLFAHSTYKTSPFVQFFLLLFGAATFEQSALKWSSQHRQHHLFTDTEHDPYGVNQGFWHAHIGWILFFRHRTNYNNVKDLRRSKLVSHQHDHHAWWAVGGGFVLPMLMAWWIGHPLGGFIMLVCLRTVLVLHSSFFVNSFAHTFGKTPYDHAQSARDNWIGALLTNGEGFHNFHHRFPSDYRNGFRWYHWDPSKWCIYILSKVGITWDLKKTSDQRIANAVQR